MKTALITTTIFVPKILERYRQFGPDVAIIVAGDIVEKLERLDLGLQGKAYLPPVVFELGLAWVRDVRRAQRN